MPYIKQERRNDLIGDIENLVYELNDLEGGCTAGDLNYTITELLNKAFKLKETPSYDKFNTLIGMLECCKLELYRRQVAIYEDIKIEENGDVF